ncbi:MAG: acyltransferase [Alistipes sp.]
MNSCILICYNILSALLPSRWHAIRRHILLAAGCEIGKGVSLNAYTQCAGNAIEIGDNTWISSGTHILSSFVPSERVKIGNCCDVGPEVLFVNGTHQIGSCHRRAGEGRCLPITIGDGCWIGARAVILGGATIGSGCVVAAGSVVIPGDYPSNCLLAGVPVIIKKQLK